MKDDTAVNQTTTILVDYRLRDSLLPQVCLLCGGACGYTISLCHDCIADLPRANTSCPVCALPMPENILCARCLNNKRPLINNTGALFMYRYPVNLIIQNIKFNTDLAAAKSVGILMAKHVLESGHALPECIVPVPQHLFRLGRRGYNQALEIARPLAEALNVPLETGLCKRSRHTRPQTDLSVSQRKQNVRNAFTLTGKNNYRHLALVDDVMTTGATMRELAGLFVATGTDIVQAWVCARAVAQFK